MKKLHQLPSPIQNQVLLRAGLCGLSLAAGIGMLALLGRIALALPFGLAALLLAANAAHVYTTAARGHYLMIRGTVLKVERTSLRHRPRALLLEVEGKALRVVLHNRHRAPADGAAVTLYIPDTAPLYEWRGLHQLSAYLALVEGE
ncbi:hypothetical protein SDC9_212669 [bioreactor metagenome]|uniref:Uncharacterized protein n=1 Tax=bioreactor metagenome TaxID=1076179 RepID=A0A645JMN6_9ZZZZ